MIYRDERDQGGMKAMPYEGMADFDGACAPAENSERDAPNRTFTLGCFRWEKTAKGDRLKRGRVIWRVRGVVAQPSISDTYAEARAWCISGNEMRP